MAHKILIIEDDHHYVKNLQEAFDKDDEQIIVAMDGEEGLAKARKEKPDLILVDIMLPKMLGLTVISKLKSKKETEHIPLIAFTNFGGETNKQRALEVGADKFVVKAEVSSTKLAKIARKYLPKG